VTPFDRSRLKPGENRLPCPECHRGDRDRALAVRLGDDGAVVWHCHRCGWAGRESDEHTIARPPRIAQEPRKTERPTRELSAWGANLWRAAMPLAGPALAYLRARSCVIPPATGHLRYLPSLSHPCGRSGPALLALVTDAVSGEPISLHRTWIRPDGSKAPFDPPRLLLKDHSKTGGVIRLWPSEDVCTGLGVAEGIETALSLAHGYTPVWALIDAGNLAEFPPLDGVGSLVIAADNDEAGRRAAERCTERWISAGRGVRVITAEREGCDLNDQVREWAR
jgi:putative DNA primase/helicase